MPEGKKKIDILSDSEDIELEKVKRPAEKKTTKKKRDGTSKGKYEKKIKELEKELKKVQAECDDYTDRYLRGLADIDNFRKRFEKEKEEYKKYLLSDFLFELLGVFDNLERAMQVKPTSKEGESILSGVNMTIKQFIDLLQKHKVQEIDADGKVFDPNIHQALAKEEKNDLKEELVLEVYQKGFLYNKKLLRPSLVKVAVPADESEGQIKDEEKLCQDE